MVDVLADGSGRMVVMVMVMVMVVEMVVMV